jgi:hypothetical protein
MSGIAEQKKLHLILEYLSGALLVLSLEALPYFIFNLC